MAYYGKGTSGQALTDQTAPSSSHWSTVASTDYHVARFIVSAGGSADGANYTTIASAITAATSAGGVQTVFIQPGTYTENLTLAANVNLAAFACDAFTPTVIINGKCTASFAGSCSISGIHLKTNSDFCLAITGSSATVVSLVNCYINALNNTAISYTSSSGSAVLTVDYCFGNLATTGIAYFSKSGPGNLKFYHCSLENSGASSTASSISNSGLDIVFCLFNNSITNSAASANIVSSSIQSNLTTSSTGVFSISNTGLNALTTAGSANSSCSNSTFSGGSSPAITIGTGTTVVLANCVVDSSNTNAIDGAGTLKYGNVVFTNTSHGINAAITQTALSTI